MQQRNEVSVEYTCQEVQNISVLITNGSFYEESLMNWFCHWLLNKSHVFGNMHPPFVELKDRPNWHTDDEGTNLSVDRAK